MHVFLSCLLLLNIERVHGEISGCTDLGEVHPVSAQNKNLISDNDISLALGLIANAKTTRSGIYIYIYILNVMWGQLFRRVYGLSL